VGIGELEVSGANFLVEEDVLEAVGILSQAKKLSMGIASNDVTISVIFQAHVCRAKMFATLINKASEMANTTERTSEKADRQPNQW